MVTTCFLCKWTNEKYPRRSFHKFPSNDMLKQKWLDILGKSHCTIGKRTSLCSLHFEEDCFRYGLVYGNKILKDGSMPTLFLTKGDIEHYINSVDEMGFPESLMQSTLHTPYSTTRDTEIKDSTLEMETKDKQSKYLTSKSNDIQNIMQDSLEICTPTESLKKSGPLDVQPDQDEILSLKKKILMLKRSVKRLRNSRHKMKLQMAELKLRKK